MDYSLTVHAHTAILHIHSKFFGALRRELLDTLVAEVLATECPRLVVDLSHVEFLDSSGIGLLVGATQRLRAAGGDLRLAAMRERVKTMLHVARLLGSVFDDYPDVGAACESFAPPAVPA